MLQLYYDIITHKLPFMETTVVGIIITVAAMTIIDIIWDKIAKRRGDA